MIKILKDRRVIIGIVIIITVLSFAYFKRKSSLIENKVLLRIPSFLTVDIYGKTIKSDDLKGNFIYVQFVRPLDDNNINLFKNVYNNWKDNNIRFLFITKAPKQMLSQINTDDNKVIVISNNYNEIESKFNISGYGHHYLFAKNGNTIYSSGNDVLYEEGIKIVFQNVINKDNFAISEFIKEKEYVDNVQGFEMVSNIVHKEKRDYYIFSMFSSFCETCTPKPIIEWLNKLHSMRSNSINVISILSNKYNDKDVDALKSQYGITFSVLISDNALGQKWNKYIYHYNERKLNSIIFIINKTGQIIKVLDPNCSTCWKSFFDYFNKLIKKGV